MAKDSVITLQNTLATSFHCGSISLLDANTFVVSTYNNDPRPVCTIDVHGNEGEIQHKVLPDKTYSGTLECACAYIPSTKTIVFADAYQNTVYICDITSGEGRVIVNDKIRDMVRVCAGPAGTVFVCSKDTDSVIQFSLQGDVLASHTVDAMKPWIISVSKENTRLVLSNGLKQIQQFSIV